MLPSGVWRRVGPVKTDVSEATVISIFRVEKSYIFKAKFMIVFKFPFILYSNGIFLWNYYFTSRNPSNPQKTMLDTPFSPSGEADCSNNSYYGCFKTASHDSQSMRKIN
jgi:hypothetical protein